MAETRYAMLEAPMRFAISERPVVEPGAGEVRVRVHEVGVCGSDLKMWAGTHAFLRPPLVIGHEVYGTVDAVGDGANGIIEGDSVIVFPPVGCGNCFHCASGRPQLCADMRFVGGQIPGGLAESMIVPALNVIAVPGDVPRHARVLLEPLAVGVHAAARAAADAGDAALVIGGGAIGLFTALATRARGVDQVIVGEPHTPRRLRAERLGFTVFDPNEMSVSDAAAEWIRPEGADIVFDCVASEATIGAALSATRKGGRAVVVGNAPPTLQIDGLALQRGDRSLVGVLMYERSDFVEGIAMLADGLLSPLSEDDLVQPYDLQDVGDAFEAAKNGGVAAMRAVVRP